MALQLKVATDPGIDALQCTASFVIPLPSIGVLWQCRKGAKLVLVDLDTYDAPFCILANTAEPMALLTPSTHLTGAGHRTVKLLCGNAARKCAEIPGVDLVVPGTRKLEIPRLASNDVRHCNSRVLESEAGSSQLPQEPVVAFESRSRTFLQVQQGCDNGCTFCIIHQARGPSRSILPTTINRQVEQYVQQGFHEIVICGIDLGSYGADLSNGTQPAFNLASLTRELAIRHPETRFRLSSIDPAHITPDIVGVLEEHENVCPHIHLSLQSASPIILKRMKRRYSPEEAYQAIENLRRVRSDLVLSADIMAGFPTESDADYELTRAALYDLEIAYPHVFVYSVLFCR